MSHHAAGVPHPRPPDPAPDAVIAGLTPEQTAAMRHGRGPLLLVAGPGDRQDAHADAPRRLPAGERPCRAAADPRRHVQRARRR
jgi:hypothetical protein